MTNSILQSITQLLADAAIKNVVLNLFGPAGLIPAPGNFIGSLSDYFGNPYGTQSFASGGIVAGPAGAGDIMGIRASPGELILNKAQQANLAANMGGGVIVINAVGDQAIANAMQDAAGRQAVINNIDFNKTKIARRLGTGI